MRSGYRQIDHTADLALELWAPGEAELLQVAARAVIEILTESAEIPAESSRRVAIDAVDREDRLVQWLNEVIVLAVADGFLVSAAEISLGETSLEAEVRGQADASARIVTELKSATYHDLLLELDFEPEPGSGPDCDFERARVRARVVIDV